MQTPKDQPVKLPSIQNWETTDEDEIAKRRFSAKALGTCKQIETTLRALIGQ